MRPGIIMLCCFLLSFTLSGQQAPIAIVSANGATKLVNTLDQAAQQAQDNDIIYIPAGSFAGTTFSKRVTVIGVGHHPDSASVDGRTEINGIISFYAPGSVFDGAYVSNGVYVTSNSKITRINADHFSSPTGWPTAEEVTIENCIARGGDGSGHAIFGGAQTTPYPASAIVRSRIRNSIISGLFTHQTGANIFENCIFLFSGAYGIQQAGDNVYRNCIFPNINDWGNGQATATFTKCIFNTSALPPVVDAGSSTGNIFSQQPGSIFQDASGNTYGYGSNYRLKAGSPGINAGTDGKDIGIYGGQNPYDDYAIPPNPSIRKREIDAETTPAGTLKVKFNVKVN